MYTYNFMRFYVRDSRQYNDLSEAVSYAVFDIEYNEAAPISITDADGKVIYSKDAIYHMNSDDLRSNPLRPS